MSYRGCPNWCPTTWVLPSCCWRLLVIAWQHSCQCCQEPKSPLQNSPSSSLFSSSAGFRHRDQLQVPPWRAERCRYKAGFLRHRVPPLSLHGAARRGPVVHPPGAPSFLPGPPVLPPEASCCLGGKVLLPADSINQGLLLSEFLLPPDLSPQLRPRGLQEIPCRLLAWPKNDKEEKPRLKVQQPKESRCPWKVRQLPDNGPLLRAQQTG